ncbi:hypothetical protein [Kribbella sindirgiensis]|nr:hypothetical protein [Kribbella sindirgiensis]
MIFADNSPYAVMVVDVSADSEQVQDIYVVSNPEKLSHLPDASAG